jgi:hypothetical protein
MPLLREGGNDLTVASLGRIETSVLKDRIYKLMQNAMDRSRLFVVLLTVFSLGFVPFHVLTETHTDEYVELSHNGDEHDADHSDEGHVPHPESDHLADALTVGKAKFQTVAMVWAFLVAQDISIKPQLTFSRFSLQAEIPPDDSPPDRFSPRGPPLA